MDVKVCLCLFMLVALCCTARELPTTEVLVIETEEVSEVWINNLQVQRQPQPLNVVSRNEGLCSLCEEYTSSALDYLSDNQTQTKLLELLLKTCSKMPIYKDECTALVDQYVPLIFLEISKVKPEDVCHKAYLCQNVVSISQQFSQNSCDLCHQVVEEALLKLKDPDTKLDILELLLKACATADHYANKCKKLVFEYAPVILANAEHLLEQNDVCSILHACKPAVGEVEAIPEMQMSMHSAS